MRTRYTIAILVLVVAFLGAILVFRQSGGKDADGIMPDDGTISLEDRLSACGSFPNGSTQTVKETTRMFISIPKDIYKDVNLDIRENGATAGYVSNGGQYGYAMGADQNPECFVYYFEFNGEGNVDLRAKSGKRGIPDYTLRVVVTK